MAQVLIINTPHHQLYICQSGLVCRWGFCHPNDKHVTCLPHLFNLSLSYLLQMFNLINLFLLMTHLHTVIHSGVDSVILKAQ